MYFKGVMKLYNLRWGDYLSRVFHDGDIDVSCPCLKKGTRSLDRGEGHMQVEMKGYSYSSKKVRSH